MDVNSSCFLKSLLKDASLMHSLSECMSVLNQALMCLNAIYQWHLIALDDRNVLLRQTGMPPLSVAVRQSVDS